MKEDLLEAREKIRDRNRLVIISSEDAGFGSALAQHVLPCEARLRKHVGGACHSLHARVARYILEDRKRIELGAVGLQRHLERLLKKTPELRQHNRDRTSDDAICRFISAEAKKVDKPGWTSFLRAFRANGNACEQRRFKELFLGVLKLRRKKRRG
jgi:hypothetical protein